MIAILAVARGTFREAVRDRVLFLVLGFGVVLLMMTRILSPIAMGEGDRITIDLGLSAIGLLGVVIDASRPWEPVRAASGEATEV